jgi:hypothetical protein
MASIYVSYNPTTAKKYQDEIVAARKKSTNPIDIQPKVEPIQTPINKVNKTPTVDKDIEQMGYEDQTIQEKNKNVRGFFK